MLPPNFVSPIPPEIEYVYENPLETLLVSIPIAEPEAMLPPLVASRLLILAAVQPPPPTRRSSVALPLTLSLFALL